MSSTSPVVLVTGGAGFIGSHTVVELIKAGYEVVVLDNLCNCNEVSLQHVKQIVNRDIPFRKVDLCDKQATSDVFDEFNVDYVIHFAAKKAVGESKQVPLFYYQNNLTGMLNLLQVMESHKVKQLIYSSSATVYGCPTESPVKETFPVGDCENAYGFSKYAGEVFLKNLYESDNSWRIINLRYFNPIGAHPSGLIGEDPHGEPANLMPYVSQVAIQRLPILSVFGNDYPTSDGTGVRDYLHVVDCAKAHVIALKHLETHGACKVYNIGTGRGYSVLEVITAMEKASGRKIPYKICPRRPGDIPAVWADCQLASQELSWTTQFDLEKMCKDQWNWQTKFPNGFPKNLTAGDH